MSGLNIMGHGTMFFIGLTKVHGESMEPTLQDQGQYLVQKQAYLWEEPQYKDIVIVEVPELVEHYLIKRVIGKEGDLIEIKENIIWWHYILFAIYHKVSWKYLNGTIGEHLTGIQTVLVDGSNARKYLICYYFVKIILFPITLLLLWIKSKEDVWWLAKVCGVIIEKRR